MSMTAYNILECRKNKDIYLYVKRRERDRNAAARARTSFHYPLDTYILYYTMYIMTHARRAKGNPVPIPEPGSGTAYNSGPRKSVRRGNPK